MCDPALRSVTGGWGVLVLVLRNACIYFTRCYFTQGRVLSMSVTSRLGGVPSSVTKRSKGWGGGGGEGGRGGGGVSSFPEKSVT